MTLVRLRETRAKAEAERRASPTWQGGIGGYSIIDPSAIPPPGMGGNRNIAGVNVTPHNALSVDAVFTSLRIISNGIINLGDPRAYTEALADDNMPYREYLANQPAFLSDTFGGGLQYQGRQQTVWSMGLWGEAWWYVLERVAGLPSAVEVLNPAALEIKQENGKLVYIYGTSNGQRVELDPANLIHIPHMSLPGSLRGLQASEYAGINMAIALAAMEYGSRWFSQGASPSYILTTQAKLGQDEVERIAQHFMVDHSGLTQAWLPLVVDNGLGVQKTQSTPDEAQYLQTLEYSRSVIAAYFGIPASLLGNALQKLSPNPPHTVQEESIRMVQWTLSGYINPLEEIYSRSLPTKVKVAFDRSKIMQADAMSFAAEVLALRQTNSMSINEIRTRKFNLPPVAGGDEVVAPLASNTSPEQTENPATPEPPDSETDS